MDRKHHKHRLLVCILALVLTLALPGVALAADMDVAASSTSVKAGDTVTVTVTVSGAHIAVAEGVFTYDPAVLSYVSSTGGASDGFIQMVSAQQGGSSSLTAVIKFVATGGGEAEIRVTLRQVLNYDGDALGGAEAGVKITVASPEATPGQPGESPSPVDISLTGVAAENVTGAAAQMYIWRSLNSLTLPSGFADRQVTYRDEYVGGAAIPDTEDLILLYLSERDGSNAGYYVYDAEHDVLFPYLTMQSVSKYYTLIWPDEGADVPEGYTETTLEWKKKEVPAWIREGSDGSVYLVYARDSAGERGWYLYDTVYESVQRYAAPAQTEPYPEPAASPTPQPADKPVSAPPDTTQTFLGIRLDSTLFLSLTGGCLLLLVITAVMTVLYLKATSGKRKAARMDKRLKRAAQKMDNES
jgi:hypothetical protein